MEETNKVVNPLSEETQGTVAQQPVSASQGGTEIANQSATPSSATPVEQNDKPKQETSKAEEGKIQALERERNAYSQRLKEAEKELNVNKAAIEEFRNTLGKDKDVYDSFRGVYKKEYNVDLGEFDQVFTKSGEVREGKKEEISQALGQSEPVNPEQLKEQIKREITGETMFNEGYKKFSEKYSEMNLEAEDKVKLQETLTRMKPLVDAYGKINPNSKIDEILEMAYNALPERRDAERKASEDQGKDLGRALQNSANAINSSVPTGNQVADVNLEGLTGAERESYDRLMRTSPGAAKIFMQNLKR